MKFLTRQEELILLAIFRLKSLASIIKIRKYLIDHTGKEWTIGAIYVPMERMVRHGLLKTFISYSKNDNCGRKSIKSYEITENGTTALQEIKRVHDSMWFSDSGKGIVL